MRPGTWRHSSRAEHRSVACTVGSVIEVIKFRLSDQTSVDEFLEINATYQTDFVYQQVGLQRRTVAQGLGGEWLSLTVWRSKSDIHRAHEEAGHSPVAHAFEACVEPSSKTLEYFKELPG
jgi:hypothetical protein